MRHYKAIEGGYILAIGTGGGYEEITAAEYDEIMAVIQDKPAATDTTDYRLKTDLTWEAYQIEPPDPDPELDEAEALAIILGGAT